MATIDKAKNSTQQAKGKVKEAAGKVRGNDKLQAKGNADQTKGNLKQAGEMPASQGMGTAGDTARSGDLGVRGTGVVLLAPEGWPQSPCAARCYPLPTLEKVLSVPLKLRLATQLPLAS